MARHQLATVPLSLGRQTMVSLRYAVAFKLPNGRHPTLTIPAAGMADV